MADQGQQQVPATTQTRILTCAEVFSHVTDVMDLSTTTIDALKQNGIVNVGHLHALRWN